MIFYNFNLQMQNLWLGLCRGEEGLPTQIRDMEYKCNWIELEFQNSSGNSVKPEMILSTEKESHALLLEWKEGLNVSEDQLVRYNQVTTEDLVKRAVINPGACSKHDICIIGKFENIERLSIGIEKITPRIPLLSVSDVGLKIEKNQFRNCLKLNEVFANIQIDMKKIPMHIIPFDLSSDNWIIAGKTIPKIIEYINNDIPQYSVEKLASDVIPIWDSTLSMQYKHDLVQKINNVLLLAAKFEFNKYIKRDKASDKLNNCHNWRIIKSIKGNRFDRRTREYRLLQKKFGEFIYALRTGTRNGYQYPMDM